MQRGPQSCDGARQREVRRRVISGALVLRNGEIDRRDELLDPPRRIAVVRVEDRQQGRAEVVHPVCSHQR
ncbi:MAG: hypothetical protein ACRD0H_21335, partial [Actinomycetes bacterium]